jgi:transcriptional regulator with XRE-family HTH domain
MPKPKIDIIRLDRMLQAGKTQHEIAQHFGVTDGAISKAKKQLSACIVKNVALENAHKIVNQNLNAVEQLQKINDYANELLDLLMRWNRGDEEALQVLESQVSTKQVRIGKEVEFIKEFKFRDPRELALKAMGEIRGQLNLQLEIFKTLYDMKAVEEFQQEVLEAIGEVSRDVRARIVSRLNQRRALRGAVKFN